MKSNWDFSEERLECLSRDAADETFGGHDRMVNILQASIITVHQSGQRLVNVPKDCDTAQEVTSSALSKSAVKSLAGTTEGPCPEMS